MSRKRAGLGIFLTVLALLCACALVLAGCGKKDPTPETPKSGEEAGVYYYDADKGEEYLLTLGGECQYTLAIGSTSESGSYKLEGETLTLTANGASTTATAANGAITLTRDGAQMRFLKKVYYNVKFETAGGSAVSALTVLNGKTIPAPAAPTRDGYVFLGWYIDAEYSEAFTFDGTPVTADITLYARFAKAEAGKPEYNISYDLGYDGETIADATTIGGKLYAPAVPAAREGFTFVGWWVSTANLGDQLSYRFEEGSESAGTVFDSDTTLFAVWQPSSDATAAPAVSVTPSLITWDSVGSAAYVVKVIAPDGSVVVDDQRTTSTTFTVDFSAAGDYRIEVTAINAGGTAVSTTTVRYFRNLALPRVSGFTVMDPSVLVFRGVAGAEKYLITVSCGNEKHQHTAYDNGTAVYFSFANCEMKQGGIVFTVTAVADGKASSAATFVYEKNLDAVDGVTVTDDVLTWNAVKGASMYLVTIGDKTCTVLGTSFGLGTLADGSYTISVTPVTHGANSPAATSITYKKETPAVPANIRLVGTVLSWDAVDGATSYQVKFNGKTLDVPAGETSLDLADAASFTEGADYTLSVKVTGANASAETEEITVRYNQMGDKLTYGASVLRWTPVLGALSYEVQMNDGAIITVENGENFLYINSFDRAGENTLRVRCNNGSYVSEWVEIKVTAHAVTLDSRGGSEVESLFKAVGDVIELPTLSKKGYDFAGWYNLPGGADANGREYTDRYFVESGEQVLYAFYTSKAYRVRYETGDDSDEWTTVYYGKNFTFKAPASADGTKVFGGWYSAPYGAGIAFTDAEGNSLAPWNFTDDEVTVYAFWVDGVLNYTQIGGGYAVSKGPRINLVSSVTIPAEYNGLPVTEILMGAFENCTTLTELRLPDSLLRIAADTAFAGCTNLKSVEVYASGASGARYSSADGVLFDSGDSVTPHALRPVFMPAAKTGTYTVPGGVDMIPRSAFAGSKLSKIILPVSVKEIGVEAFANCTELTSVAFEEAGATNGVAGLTIGDRAFLGCEKLAVLTLPARLENISLAGFRMTELGISFTDTPSAFEGCTALSEIIVAKGQNAKFTSEDGVLIGENGTALLYFPAAKRAENYQIPAGITRIGEGAFLSVSGLTGELILPGRVTSIGTAAFADCAKLTAVTFEEGLSDVTIGDYAFAYTGISVITFNEGSRITGIGADAFAKDDTYDKVDDEKELILPATLTSVGDRAFSGFGSLVVTIEEGTAPLSFGNDVFYDCYISSLTLPANVTALPNFFGGLSVEEILVSEGNKAFVSVEGVLYSKNADGNPGVLLVYPSGKSDESFTIPGTVTAIADGAFKYHSDLSEITIPASVTSIGKEAFRESSLTAVTFEDGDKKLTIGDYAFCGTSIASVELPARAQKLGEYALADMSQLSVLTLGGIETIGAHAFEETGNWRGLNIVIPATVTEIGDFAFNEAENVESITFEGGSALRTIGAYAFAETGITEFTVPGSVETIGSFAFADCSYLESLSFEEGDADLIFGVPYQGEYGMRYGHVIDGTGIKELHLPARLTEIGREAFALKYSLKSVTFGEIDEVTGKSNSRLTTIGQSAFDSCSLEDVFLPASLRNTDASIAIGESAFAYAINGTLTFEMGGDAPLTIGASAFSGIDMETITLPARLATFTDANGNTIAPLANGRGVFSSYVKNFVIEGKGGEYATSDGVIYSADMTELIFCPAGKEGTVTIPASVRKIRENAFANCSGLTAVTFESGSALTEIGSLAFNWCTGLTELALPDSVAKIGADAFGNCTGLTALTLPAAFTEFDSSIISGCKNLRELNVSATNTHYKSIDGVLFSADGKTLVYYLGTRTDTDYTIPAGTETIGEGSFNANEYLAHVTIPASVKLIGEGSFASCKSLASVTFEAGNEPLVIGYNSVSYTSLSDVTIPARAVAINGYAFSGVKTLKTIRFADGSKLNSIGDGAFASTGLEAILLPASVREIGEGVFENCGSLVVATLSEGLVTAGESLFEGCTSLETVYLPATLETLGNFAFRDCESLKNVNFAKDSVIKVLPVGTFIGCTGLESIELPASITEIPDKNTELFAEDKDIGLFSGCTSLKRVTFAEGSKCSKIGDYAFGKTALEEFVFPSAVTSIGVRAFYHTNLRSVTIPTTVTLIDTGAFDGCSLLTSVRLGAGVKELKSTVFANCESLTSFTIPATLTAVSPEAFSGCDNLDRFLLEEGSTSFTEKDGVIYTVNWEIALFPVTKTEYTIPKEVVSLPENFFKDYSIASISVEEGNTAFQAIGGVLYDAAMTKIIYFGDSVTEYEIPATLPSGMTEEEFFEVLFGATNLKYITVAAGNTAYQAKFGAVYDMDWNLLVFPMGATEYKIPVEVTNLSPMLTYNTFADSALETVTFEEGERAGGLTIGNYMFQEAANLQYVSLPEGTVKIGRSAFSKCYALRVVNLPSTLSNIMGASGAFSASSELEAINVAPGNASYVSVDGVLFTSGMSMVCFPVKKTSFTIPASMTSLPSLSSAKGLRTITFERDENGNEVSGEALSIASNAFRNLENLVSVELPSRISSFSVGMFSGCTSLTSIRFADGVEKYRTDDSGVLYEKNETGWTLLYIPAGVKFDSFEVPADVTVINGGLFANTGVKTITFADSDLPLELKSGEYTWCENLGAYGEWHYLGAFALCSQLTSITLPNRVTVIGEGTFDGCAALTDVTIPAGVTSIGTEAFSGCTSLESLTLPAGLESLGASVFKNCTSLTSITLPASVAKTGYYLFENWTSAQTVNVAFAEDKVPAGFDRDWLRGSEATVNYAN